MTNSAIERPATDQTSVLDALVDPRLVRLWLYWGMFWLLAAPSVGVIISTYFNYPNYLGETLEIQFGRLRPMHINGVIWGAFSTLFIGLCYYLVPRLSGVPLSAERLGYPLAWIWNLTLLLGLTSLAFGYNQGLEAGELPFLADLVIFSSIVFLTWQFIDTIAHRTDTALYVSAWYLIAAFNGLFIHYIVGLWITPAGYVLIYYFLPASVKNPIYSHKLSLVGFWSLALFYPFVGIHHYLYSPLADWAETLAIVTSMLLIIPVWTVLQNFFGTMVGRWHEFGRNLTAKFLIAGSLLYLVGCFQGSVEVLRSLQQPTHFTDFVISHSHLTVFGTFVIWAVAGLVYVWPRLYGRHQLWSFKLGNWSFWLIVLGISLMGLLDLTAMGLQQGFMWMRGTEWLDALTAVQPYWLVRTFSGVMMDTGLSLLVYNLMRTALAADKPLPENADTVEATA
jgi:cytochrome c oxidase cbb3-type subunit 1